MVTNSPPSFSDCKSYLQAGLPELERYLLSEQLFWPLSSLSSAGKLNCLNLTIGSILLYQQYAHGLAQTPAQQAELRQLETQLEVVQSRWRVAWERKAARGLQSRLRQWSNALEEIRADPDENAAYYRYEVRARVMAELLLPQAGEIDSTYLEYLESLDLLLRALLEPGDFIWKVELATAFPSEPYWYLWGLPREP